MKYTYLIVILLSSGLRFTGITGARAQVFIGTTEVDTLSVITGLDTPWEILWGSDNHIWITERQGRVSRLNPETGELDVLLTIPGVHEESESGLLGMALHPDLPDTPYVFVVYNYFSGGIKERIARYDYTGSALVNPLTLLENIQGGSNHDGSRLVIDDAYKLYITTGDAGNTGNSQNPGSLNGKILRMNLDGSIPTDNPEHGSYVWTLGHRNPQGLVIAPDGKMYGSEHGPNNDDELNLIEKGQNYGWPDVHGFCDSPSETTYCDEHTVREPLMAWTPTLAVAGIDYYNHEAIPDWDNNILMTTLKEKELLSLTLSDDGESITGTSTWFNNWFGRLRDVCVAPDGRVFLAVSNRDGRGDPVPGDDRIVQIKSREVISSLASQETTARLTIYPNPVTGVANIKTDRNIQNGNITIYDLTGKNVFSDTFNGEEYHLKKGKLLPGYYVLKITNGTFSAQAPLKVM